MMAFASIRIASAIISKATSCRSSGTSLNKDFLRNSLPVLKYSSLAASSVSLDPKTDRLVVRWPNQNENHPYPLVWLRDNCQCPLCYDQSAQSRTITFSDFRLDHKAKNCVLSGQKVTLTWDDGHESVFDLKWLRERSFRQEEQKAWLNSNQPLYQTWNADYFRKNVPVLNFRDILNEDEQLLKWLTHLDVLGVCLISQVPDKLGQVGQLADRVAFVRKTHYGEEFAVQAVADAANVAYTSGYLQLHTDLPYYEYKPGVNLLHCYIQYAGTGGDSLLSDGFHVAEQLRAEDPSAYKILAETEVSWLDIGQEKGNNFHKVHNDPVICERKSGVIRRINFSQPQRDSHMAVPVDQVEGWYSALKKFYHLALDPRNLAQFKLKPGEMVTFNNLRVLHGRTAFGADLKGERLVQGAYLDWDEVRSRIRVLKAKLNKE